MDYISEFDIQLEKEQYYAGEIVSGNVILTTTENFKLKAIKVLLRGKAHSEWSIIVSGERRTVKDDQVFMEDRSLIWGREKIESVPILPRGHHSFPFKFSIPESSLPCSFESKPCTIRYCIKVTIDIPYASPPQGIKYFTIIGPHIDCMDEQYLKPLVGQDRRRICCLCCERGLVKMKCTLERSAYCCGESIRLKADIDNKSTEHVQLKLRLTQYVEFFVERGPITLNKEVNHVILEYRGELIPAEKRTKFDSGNGLVVPVMPPTLSTGICRLIHIYYVLRVWVEMEKSGEDLHMNFPLTIATCPFRIPNSSQQPVIAYEPCCDHAEGGVYIGPEFQLGQVYDGTLGIEEGETLLLYRPVYACVKSSNNPATSLRKSTVSSPKIKVDKKEIMREKEKSRHSDENETRPRRDGRNSVTDSSLSDKEVSSGQKIRRSEQRDDRKREERRKEGKESSHGSIHPESGYHPKSGCQETIPTERRRSSAGRKPSSAEHSN